MEKGKKKLIIKILGTATVLVAAIAICTFVAKKTTQSVEASTNVLKGVSDTYKSGDTFKILEIVPEHEAATHENEEIGYFMEDRAESFDFLDVSRAKSIGSFADPEHGVENLLTMRDFGLIKESGVDYGNRSGYVSDNPVYGDKAVFANYPNTGFEPAGQQFVYGIYSMDPGNAGDYKLKDGYIIDASGTICATGGSVSGNSTVSDNQIGGASLTRTLSVIANTAEVNGESTQAPETPIVDDSDGVTVTVEDEEDEVITPEEETPKDDSEEKETPKDDSSPQPEASGLPQEGTLQNLEEGVSGTSSGDNGQSNYYQWTGETVYSDPIPVEEGDRFNKALPEGIEYVGNGQGNVNFTESPEGKYFGYATKPLYYNADSNLKFHNGQWFNELVFGDKNCGITIALETKTPDEISSVDDYDLIYISGRNAAYINKGIDLTADLVMDIYNQVVGDEHLAVIMDYALIDTAIVMDKASTGQLSNMEKLALLLWQKDQMAVLTDTVSGNGTSSVTNGFDVTTIIDSGDTVITGISGFSGVPNNVWVYLAGTGCLSGYGNFVAGSVYVYDHKLQYFDSPKAQIDAYDFFGNGDFNSKYADFIVTAGLSQVEYAIKVNNNNLDSANQDKRVSENVTPAVVVQYILAYDGSATELVKNDLRILEIQPCRDFSFNTAWGSETYTDIKNGSNPNKNAVLANRREFVEKYLGEPFYVEGNVDMVNIDYVSFTSMTIDQFICMNENINEEYDMIYIGTNHSANKAYETFSSGNTGNFKHTNNREATASNGLPSQITDFLDNAMDGMVYFNIGDEAHVDRYSSQGKTEIYSLWGSISKSSEIFRLAGKDLTKYKKTELLDFLDTGYPIIVAGDMVETDSFTGIKVINPTKYSGMDTGNGHDHGRVDNSSVLYEFLEIATGQCTDPEEIGAYSATGYENFVSESDVEAGRVDKNIIISAVNTTKLAMNVTERPTDYEYTTDAGGKITSFASMSPEANGKYYFNFEFTIENISPNDLGTTIYNPHLYVDVNADGKFSETEELEGAVVTNALTGVEVSYTASVHGNAYSLTPNVLYRLRREVPDGYQGVLPWCLKVAQYTDPKISASETGYSAIKGTKAETIKILQIMNDKNNNLNLQASIAGNSNKYGVYINQLKDLQMFDIQVISVDMNTYRKGTYNRRVEHKDSTGKVVSTTYVASKYYEHLDDFDMLILGFSDNYVDLSETHNVSDPVLTTLADYVRSGKPVLLTHDFMAHYPNYAVVKTLRDLLGMDRYGVTDKTRLPEVSSNTDYSRSDPADAAKIAKIEASGRRVAYQPGSNKKILLKNTQGFTNYIQTKYAINPSKSSVYYYLQSPDMTNWSTKSTGTSNQDYVMYIDKVNDGQITNYPYKLPEAFAVNKTHGQYFQPNMEADQDEDGTADISIWYTLAYGSSNPNDPDDPTGKSITSKYSDGVYNISPKDGVNNYYIFNSGNVTYTGSGHSALTTPSNTYEAQLFINTMVAAYKAGIKSPTVTYYDGPDLNSSVISNIAIPYDENIGISAGETDPTTGLIKKAESSIIKDRNGNYQYPFVAIDDSNATKVYFRVSDPNLVKGTKEISIRFLQEVPSGTTGAELITSANGESVYVKELKMPFYSADFTQQYAYGTGISSGVMYGLRLPLDLLKSTGNFRIYVEAQTKITNISVTGDKNVTESGKVYTDLGVTKMDLLKLD